MTGSLLEWIVSAGVLIFVVLILRSLLGRHISASLRYALWAVVLVRLLVPPAWLSLALPAAVPRLPAWTALDSIREESRYLPPVQPVPEEDSQAAGGDGPILDGSSFGYDRPEGGGRTAKQYADRASPLTLARWLWVAGSIALGAGLLACSLRFACRLRRSRRLLACEDVPLPVYTAAGLPSPCLFGFFLPAVYVTEEAARDPDMLRHVLAHELTHYRHGDHLWSVLRGAALAIHWWNPLVSLSRRDGELACDEGALKRLGDGERQAYGETLLRLVTAKAKPWDLLSFATTMTGEKRSLRERITRIARRPRQLTSAAAAVSLALLLAVMVTFGRASDAPPDEAGPDTASAAAPEPANQGGDAWSTAQITLDEAGVPHIRYDLTNGIKDLRGEPIPAPRAWADQSLAGRQEARSLAFSPEIWARLVSPTDGWLVASYERDAGAADLYVYRTADGGMNWTEVTAPGIDHAVAAVGFVSPDRLIVAQKIFVGAPVYQTKDGGMSWELVNLPWADAEVSAIHVSGNSIQMALLGDGSSAWTMTSSDCGDTWVYWDNAALDLLLSEMTAEDIQVEGAAAGELAELLRDASPHRWSRLYTGEGSFAQTEAWIWCEAEWALPLAEGGTLHLANSYRNKESVMIGWEADGILQNAIYRSQELHALVGRMGVPYPTEILPYTPDLNRDGRPDQISLCRPQTDSKELCLRFLMETEDGWETWEETASSAHAGWVGLFLVQMDGKDCLLRYSPYSGGGDCNYRYQLFYLRDDGAELIQGSGVRFDFNFDLNGTDQHRFDPREIAAFMDEVNELLAGSTPLLITDPNLNSTFEREGCLRDSLGWLDGEEGFTRDASKTLLENLLAYRNYRLAAAAIPSWYTVFTEIKETDIVSTGSSGVSALELVQALRGAAQGQGAEDRGFSEVVRRSLEVTYTRAGDTGEQTLLLEAGEQPDLIRVTLSGQATALRYTENPRADGSYLHDVPYSRTSCIANGDLYRLIIDAA